MRDRRSKTPSGDSHRSSTTHFAHPNHIGSARLLTGLDQSIVQNLDYLPFGELNSTDSGINTLHFTGKERDSESGLDNFGARYNSSSLSRFMSPDSSPTPQAVPFADFSNPQSLNLYGYVWNSPLTANDPDGHDVSGCPAWINNNLFEGTALGGPVEGDGCVPQSQPAQPQRPSPKPSTAPWDAYDPINSGSLGNGAQPDLRASKGQYFRDATRLFQALHCAAQSGDSGYSSDASCWGYGMSFSGGTFKGTWSADAALKAVEAAQRPTPSQQPGSLNINSPNGPFTPSIYSIDNLKPSPLPTPGASAYACPAIWRAIQLELSPSAAQGFAVLQAMYQKSCK